MPLIANFSAGDLGSAIRAKLNSAIDFVSGREPDVVAGEYTFAYDYVTLSAGQAPNTPNMYLIPLPVSQKKTLSSIGSFVAVGEAGKAFGFAVYAHNPTTNRPTGNALASTLATLSAATSAVTVDGPLQSNLALTSLVWIAFQTNSTTATWQCAPAGWAGVARLVGNSSQSTLVTGVSSVLQSLTTPNATFGTWPDLTSATFTPNQSPRFPALHVKYASVP